ncbi:MAG: hypothetical protein P4L87_21940 [Formivibrio sp.]|nr:hypothetical protein [Formivibrio sp.]
MRTLIICFAAFLLAACAAPLHVENGRLVPPPGQGYVIAAVTLDTLNYQGADAGILLHGQTSEMHLDAQTNTSLIRAPDKEKDGVGKLHVVALPVGSYRVTELYGSWIDDSFSGMSFRSRSSFALDEGFDLADGEVLYLGDYHVSLNFEPSFSRTDTRRRDFNDLTERQSVHDFSNITVKLPPARTTTN